MDRAVFSCFLISFYFMVTGWICEIGSYEKSEIGIGQSFFPFPEYIS